MAYVTVDISKIKDRNDPCSICLSKFKKNVSQTQCGHNFHRKCLEKWLNISPTCPMCKGAMRDVVEPINIRNLSITLYIPSRYSLARSLRQEIYTGINSDGLIEHPDGFMFDPQSILSIFN